MFKTIVLAFILFSLFGLNANALDINIKGAKENNVSYSILHLNDKNKFFKIKPSRDCQNHCAVNSKNKMILDYLDVEHLGFV